MGRGRDQTNLGGKDTGRNDAKSANQSSCRARVISTQFSAVRESLPNYWSDLSGTSVCQPHQTIARIHERRETERRKRITAHSFNRSSVRSRLYFFRS